MWLQKELKYLYVYVSTDMAFWTILNSTQLKICIGMSAKLIANGHLQIYKYTENGKWPNKRSKKNYKI